MNKYEILYDLKENFELQISKNKIFNLSFSDASLVTLEKVGVFYKILINCDQEALQKYIKSKAKTNKTQIDLIVYIQESLKWMFRWYAKYCNPISTISPNEIVAEDIFDLMGITYAYENFYKMWDLHSGKKVNYIKQGNKYIFDYIDEEVYKTHSVYDSFFRQYSLQKQINEFHRSNININDYKKAMDFAHQTDFKCSFPVEFNGFSLEDYRSFSSSINELFAEKSLKNPRFITPGEDGVIVYKEKEWIDIISRKTLLPVEKTKSIIDFFTFNPNDSKSDISLTYFIPYANDLLIISESIFNLTRPESNALRLLKTKNKKNYDRAQNFFENQQIEEIQNSISKKFLIPEQINKDLKNRPGMDLIVYDKDNNHLQVIELKYKIPIESSDIRKLDNELLSKAYKQLMESRKIVDNNLTNILSQYFGPEFGHYVPLKVDFFILTNYSIGTGINTNLNLPTPILLIEHYIELMQSDSGMEEVHKVLNDIKKGIDTPILKRYCRFSLLGKKLSIPEYNFWVSMDQNNMIKLSKL